MDLQLSNNRITALPDALGNLVELERLGLAGNRLRSLPEVWPGLADIACRIIGCRLTQETRVQHALDDVAVNMRQALCRGHRGVRVLGRAVGPRQGGAG